MPLDLMALSQSVVQKIRQRNVLGPMQWIMTIACVLCLWGAKEFRDDVAIFHLFIYVALGIMLFTCAAYAFFALTKPEMLLSEKHQERRIELQYAQSPDGRVMIDPTTRKAVPNPAQPALLSPPTLSEKPGDTPDVSKEKN